MSKAKGRRYGNKGGNGRDREAVRGAERTLAQAFAVMCGEAETCGKRRYPTKGAATNAIGRTIHSKRGNGDMGGANRLKVYRCDVCAGPRNFHIDRL